MPVDPAVFTTAFLNGGVDGGRGGGCIRVVGRGIELEYWEVVEVVRAEAADGKAFIGLGAVVVVVEVIDGNGVIFGIEEDDGLEAETFVLTA